MLIEKSKQLIQLSQDKLNQEKIAKNLQVFQSRQKQITEAVATTQTIVEALQGFRNRGIMITGGLQKVNDLLSIVVNAEAEFQKNPEWIIGDDKFKGNELKSNVAALKSIIEQQLSRAWKNYLEEKKIPNANSEMLTVLEKVKGFKFTIQQIRSLDEDIKEIKFPKNNVDFEKYERKIEQLKQCWGNLNSDDVPLGVLELLKAAANQGASLELLTDEVKDWIKKYNISDSLKIRLV
ncbi:hypothetical protein NIES2101_03715 [Calothrix sp. HK-06]|nr:hypothetical protein NIES2101_03715 [Calothrix sp. HK-06]